MIYYIGNHTHLPFDEDGTIVSSRFEDFQKWSEKQDIFEVDSETTGLFDFKNRMVLLQIGNFDNQFVFDFEVLTAEEKDWITDNIFLSERIKIFHNASFDVKFIWFSGMDVKNIYDTMLAELLIYAGRDVSTFMEQLSMQLAKDQPIGKRKGSTYTGWYSLQRCAYSYCNVYLPKSQRDNINRITIPLIKYAAKDVKYLSLIRKKQMEVLKHLKMANDNCQDKYTVLGLENRSCLSFAHMEYCGIFLDRSLWADIEKEVYHNFKDTEKKLHSYVWKDDRLSSFRLIYEDLFTKPTKTSNVLWSSSAQVLKVFRCLDNSITATNERILSKYKHLDLVMLYGEYSKSKKMYTSFARTITGFINPKTNRIHTSFRQILNTGRVSSSNPNMQQIPARTDIGARMRSAFIPEKGKKIVGGDFSGCELRIIAELSGDPVWNKAYAEGQDLHSVLCTQTFDISLEDVRKKTPFKPDISYRDVQKTIDFGLAYGMTEHKLGDTIDMSPMEAKKIIDRFFEKIPVVQNFLERMARFSKDNGYITTAPPYYRKRFFDNYQQKHNYLLMGEIERAGKNMPIQGTNADITKLAQIEVYDYIRNNNYWDPRKGIDKIKMVMVVHDEIQTECVAEVADEWSIIMESLMKKSAEVVLKNVGMIVDCKKADKWSK